MKGVEVNDPITVYKDKYTHINIEIYRHKYKYEIQIQSSLAGKRK